jgi:hypothetical protein
MLQQVCDLAVLLGWSPHQHVLHVGIRVMPAELGRNVAVDLPDGSRSDEVGAVCMGHLPDYGKK